MIYTAIEGGYDRPRDDVKVFSGYNRFSHPRMNAKIFKVLSHLYVEDEYSVWIDGNLELKASEKDLIAMMNGKDVLVFDNPYRGNVYEEAEECKRLGLDSDEAIDLQVERYRKEGYKGGRLAACFLIVRRHTDEVKRLNEQWWAEICRGSWRDQISFPYVFGDAVEYLPSAGPFNNDYFIRRGHA